jgi:hypothetical protein
VKILHLIDQATVVCRQLGFAAVDRFTTDSAFGNVPEDFSYDETYCYGSEDTLVWISQNFVSAENFSDKFSSNFGIFST